MNPLLEDAHAVLLPAFAGLSLDDAVLRHLDGGGLSVLLGERREEYLGRRMSAERQANESAGQFRRLTETARRRAGRATIVAVDQEPGGIQRLHRLVPALPDAGEARVLSSAEIERRAAATARAARELGVNLFLAPIVDLVTGANPWLEGRHAGSDPARVAHLACSFVRGVQAAGVAATAKHFPGHPVTELDPALHEAVVPASLAALQPGIGVFREMIAAGVKAVMAGPALVPAIDDVEPSSTSRETLAYLRGPLAFDGLVISDDLDAPGILRGRSVAAAAVASLAAGADLLLVSSEAGLATITASIVAAVERGALPRERLADAARRVRAFASELDAGAQGGTQDEARHD
ncbi:glycoside hydrolase family 3 N-terminal domain-containing protein [Burkholderia gladioli]|uniref:glycoside hydrolase family 3 N-terminal domain-containing protein n=1 Tax=Burkholderia gladioli TaxID=28095 RepID=UPI001FC8D9C3|nr:glycoside hydrolase family 3 N-terminal domain-containing protein [Burkholderia gladioli]